jgi:general secretion pathway protein G
LGLYKRTNKMSVWKIALGVLLGLVMAYLLWALVTHVGESVGRPSVAERARKQAALTQIENFKTALERFKTDCDRFPTTDEGLNALIVRPPNAKGWEKPYLESVPSDPWGNPYVYRSPGSHRTDSYDLYSTGPNGDDSSGENINNWKPKN